MTKQVRIENADAGKDYKLVVQVWDKYGDAEPVLVQEIPLDHPCQMAEVYVTSSRYLVVKEA